MREDWKKTKLGDVCFIRRGSSPRPIKDYLTTEGGMPWVKIGDATEAGGKYINKTAEQIKMEGVSRSVIVNPGDLILSNSGTAGVPMFMGITACIHDGWQTFRDLNGIDKEFLYYYLLYIRHILLHNAYDSVMKNLTLDMLREYEMTLPPMQEQKKIVDVLKTIDDKIENNNQINRNLSEQLEALYKENIKESDLPARNVTLDELCNIFTGRKNANQNDEDGQYMFFTCGDTPLRINSYIYDGPAIIISGNGSYTGRTLFYNGKFDLYQRTYACTLKEDVIPEYIFGLYAILKIELHKKISGGTHGSSIPYIVMNDLAKFEFDINDESFMEFSKQSKAILDTVMHNNAENEQLVKLRDSLLPKLMSGELDVSDLDI